MLIQRAHYSIKSETFERPFIINFLLKTFLTEKEDSDIEDEIACHDLSTVFIIDAKGMTHNLWSIKMQQLQNQT